MFGKHARLVGGREDGKRAEHAARRGSCVAAPRACSPRRTASAGGGSVQVKLQRYGGTPEGPVAWVTLPRDMTIHDLVSVAVTTLAEVDAGVDSAARYIASRADGSAPDLARCADGACIFIKCAARPTSVAPSHSIESLVGTTMGAYHLRSMLGRGGFGAVYEAVHVSTRECVAVKVLDVTGRTDMEQLLTEISCLMELRHPHIIQLHQVINGSAHSALVLQLARGGDLAALLQRTHIKALATRADGQPGLPEEKARRLFTQIVKAVLYAHNHGVVHRDLKLENILLATEDADVCLLTDFGLSQFAAVDDFDSSEAGSLHYLPPEVLDGRPHSGQAVDVWCLGVILFAMLTGVLPFRSPSAVAAATVPGTRIALDALASDEWEPLSGISDFVCQQVTVPVIGREVRAAIRAGRVTVPTSVSPAAASLIACMLSHDSLARPTPSQILASAWVQLGNIMAFDAPDELVEAGGVTGGRGERMASTARTSVRSITSTPSASTITSSVVGAGSACRRSSYASAAGRDMRQERFTSRRSSMEASDRTISTASIKEGDDAELPPSPTSSRARRRIAHDSAAAAMSMSTASVRAQKQQSERPPLLPHIERGGALATHAPVRGDVGITPSSPTQHACLSAPPPAAMSFALPSLPSGVVHALSMRSLRRPTAELLSIADAGRFSTEASAASTETSNGLLAYRPIGVGIATPRDRDSKGTSPATTPRITVASVSGSALPTLLHGPIGALASFTARATALSLPSLRGGDSGASRVSTHSSDSSDVHGE